MLEIGTRVVWKGRPAFTGHPWYGVEGVVCKRSLDGRRVYVKVDYVPSGHLVPTSYKEAGRPALLSIKDLRVRSIVHEVLKDLNIYKRWPHLKGEKRA